MGSGFGWSGFGVEGGRGRRRGGVDEGDLLDFFSFPFFRWGWRVFIVHSYGPSSGRELKRLSLSLAGWVLETMDYLDPSSILGCFFHPIGLPRNEVYLCPFLYN